MSSHEINLEEFGENVSKAAVKEQPSMSKVHVDETTPIAHIQWAYLSSGEYVGVGRTIARLESGMYTYREVSDYRIAFVKIPITVDDLIRFPDGIADAVLSEIDRFWTRGKEFAKYGYLHRRGYLFYGPQGSGKSSLVQQIVSDIIGRGGIVFMCGHPALLNRALHVFREIEPKRPVVCVFEDLDAIIRSYEEDEVLSLLDGENQIDRVLNIATTNYPERLDKRLVARPRRFDRLIKIDMPNADVRRFYFSRKLPKTEDIDRWVRETEGLSFAALAEAVVSVKCLGNSFEETIRILKNLSRASASSEEFREKTGFSSR
jgi:SpoVK/Ycf46/Vps4 family AAA+-type ATPase